MDYQEYRKTPHWQAVRAWALERSNWHCQIWENHGNHLEVHHNNYDHLGAERPEDVVVLCAECHELFHDRFPPEPTGDIVVAKTISDFASEDTLSRLQTVSRRMEAARKFK